MKVEIITIGDELMSGDVLDSNFKWLTERLWNAGYDVHHHTTIADKPDFMTEAFRTGLRSDLVVVTGGLGPTSDDRTLEVAAASFDKSMVEDDAALAQIEERLKVLGRESNASQRKQALHPEGSVMFPNVKGTAPGCRMEIDGTQFIFLVGVPGEMHEQWDRDVWPFLQRLDEKPTPFQQKIFRCFGAAEANLQEALKDFESETVRLSYRIKFPEILIKIACWRDSVEEVACNLERSENFIRERIGRYIYGLDDETVEKVVGRLLTERGETMSLAESCTGGYIANLITDVPGASEYFMRGIVTYSNQAKVDELGVKAETLEKFGAVSSEVAIEMAQGVSERAGTTYGIGVTGIAGPDGGSKDKPVGTVHIAVATPTETKEKQYNFPFGREYFKQTAAHVALHKLRRALKS